MVNRTQQEESDLTVAARELRDELCAMREVLAELAEALQWQNNNAEDYPDLLRGRSALSTLAEVKLPRLIEEINFGPPKLSSQNSDEPRSQRELF
jgi:hypothetical protein